MTSTNPVVANAMAARCVNFGFEMEFSDAKHHLDAALRDAKQALANVANPAKTYTPESAREKADIQGAIAAIAAAVKAIEIAVSRVGK